MNLSINKLYKAKKDLSFQKGIIKRFDYSFFKEGTVFLVLEKTEESPGGWTTYKTLVDGEIFYLTIDKTQIPNYVESIE